MAWLPTASEDVLKLATPEPTSVFVPRTVFPSRNVTTPVGGVVDDPVAITLAVNVTLCPLVTGFALEVSIVTVCAFVAGKGSTTTVTAAEVEPRCVVSPE